MSSNYEEKQKIILKQCRDYCASEIRLFNTQKAQIAEELQVIKKLERKFATFKEMKLRSFVKLSRSFDDSRAFYRQGKIEYSPIAEHLYKMCSYIIQDSVRNIEDLNDFDCIKYMSKRSEFSNSINQSEASRISGELILYIKELHDALKKLEVSLKLGLKAEMELARCSVCIKTSQNQLAVYKSKLADKIEQYIAETGNFDHEDYLVAEIIK